MSQDNNLKEKFQRVRKRTEDICSKLTIEDHVVQPVVDVSPPKWHLAHTSWFIEMFILKSLIKGYKPFNDKYGFLFNSYYESAGPKTLRSTRGNVTRPTVAEIMDYRMHVDEQTLQLFAVREISAETAELLSLSLEHEQQHQELLLYDIKYILGSNPLFPIYIEAQQPNSLKPDAADFYRVDAGIYQVGYDDDGFCFDNELGAHKVYLHGYGIMNRLSTNGEYLKFINDGGYAQFNHWLADGWDWVNKNDIKAPDHWHFIDGNWHQFSLNGGLKPLDLNAPVCHVSFYEADAFAKWQGLRLPTEFEWEVAAKLHSKLNENSNLLESDYFEPVAQKDGNDQMFGDVWEWTNSAYLPYPYYKIPVGAVGEYNGKFMINQMVLRGGSCGTARDHIRNTYRNFFYPHLRWMFSGIRLAQNL